MGCRYLSEPRIADIYHPHWSDKPSLGLAGDDAGSGGHILAEASTALADFTSRHVDFALDGDVAGLDAVEHHGE